MPVETECIDVQVADALRAVAVNSAHHASRALSKWFRKGVRLTCDGFESLPINDVARIVGSPDTPVAGVHMSLSGDVAGDVLLVLPEPAAMQVCDLMIGAERGTTKSIGAMEMSCLQETGNIVGSAFTNCLASWLTLKVIPDSPMVVHDHASSVIDPILVQHAVASDEALVCKTEFDLDGDQMEWFLLLLPSVESMELIGGRCMGDQVHQNALHSIAINAAFAASRAMSKWMRRGVRLTAEGFSRKALCEVTSTSGAEEPVVALHMQLANQLHGHTLLVLPMKTARELVDLLLHQPTGTTHDLDDMAISCLKETGNIISSAFVNSWSKWLELHSAPGPPEIRIDLLSAILQSILVEQAPAGDEVLMARASFGLDDRWLDWEFYLLPSPSSMKLIETSME